MLKVLYLPGTSNTELPGVCNCCQKPVEINFAIDTAFRYFTQNISFYYYTNQCCPVKNLRFFANACLPVHTGRPVCLTQCQVEIALNQINKLVISCPDSYRDGVKKKKVRQLFIIMAVILYHQSVQRKPMFSPGHR